MESVDDVRTAAEEVWGVFLREFKAWYGSEEARSMLVKVPSLRHC